MLAYKGSFNFFRWPEAKGLYQNQLITQVFITLRFSVG